MSIFSDKPARGYGVLAQTTFPPSDKIRFSDAIRPILVLYAAHRIKVPRKDPISNVSLNARFLFLSLHSTVLEVAYLIQNGGY